MNLVIFSFKYLFGFGKDWTDSRPAQTSVGITRIAVFSAILWVNFLVLEAMNGSAVNFSVERANSVYHPFSLLLLFDGMPGPVFWQIVQICAFIATPLAILGIATRPAMIISTVASLLLVLLDASRYSMWSHPYRAVPQRSALGL